MIWAVAKEKANRLLNSVGIYTKADLEKSVRRYSSDHVSISLDLIDDIGLEKAFNLTLLSQEEGWAFKTARIAIGVGCLPGTPGFVYGIQAEGTGYCKIGFTKNVRTRLKALQTGCPHKLKVIGSFYSVNPKECEKQLHHAFRASRVSGEWFDFGNYDSQPMAFVSKVVDEAWEGANVYADKVFYQEGV